MSSPCRANKRARIARRTREIEKAVIRDGIRRAKPVPTEWLPADNLNGCIYTKKTLTELLAKAWAADLVNLTDCYGNTASGCDPVACDLNCMPLVVDPAPDQVFFFAGVGPTSEYRRVFQDGGSARWNYKSSVVSNRKTDDPDYLYKRYLGTKDCADLRRAVVHFRDFSTGQLVWALIYLRKNPVLPGRRILKNVSSEAWSKNSAALCKAGLARRRPTHAPFSPDSLEPGSVYLLPSNFSFDESSDFFRVGSDGSVDVTFMSTGVPTLTLQQETQGDRRVVRVGMLCPVAGCHDDTPRSLEENERHAKSNCKS